MVWGIDPDGTLYLDRGKFLIVPKKPLDEHLVFMSDASHVLYDLYQFQQVAELAIECTAEEMGVGKNAIMLFNSLEVSSLEAAKYFAILAVFTMICQGAKIAENVGSTFATPGRDVTVTWLRMVKDIWADKVSVRGDKRIFWRLYRSAMVKAVGENL